MRRQNHSSRKSFSNSQFFKLNSLSVRDETFLVVRSGTYRYVLHFIRRDNIGSKDYVFTLDDDSYLGTSASMKLGEISISIWRTALGARHVASSSLQPPEDPKVHERSKKAFSHRVKYANPLSALFEDLIPGRFGEAVRQAQPIHTVGVQKLDREPLVTFIFKYRSLGLFRLAVLEV